ncbi:putative phage phi-C31 gp36 major capsid-like protein [Bacteroidales bacterium Barb7]|nr:putative phage phi-C31 gp36 major capsid-like protein [Bacteroidales bacterium Barb4]OAV76236.1 putative phage phi-C31 gp36 major capsid-like protein [Bacteroidales bacterium Barb7]
MRKKHEIQKDLVKAQSDANELFGQSDKLEQYNAAKADADRFIAEMNHFIINEQADLALLAASGSKEMKQIANRFSFVKFFNQIGAQSGRSNPLDGVEAEMVQEAKKEAKASGVNLRGFGIPYSMLANKKVHNTADPVPDPFDGMNAGGDPENGGYLIRTELQYQESLRNRMVLIGAGARFIGGLQNNIELIQGNAISIGWIDENAKGGDTKKTFTTRNISPLRAFVNVPISKQLLIQSSWDVEAMIMEDIINAHAELLETAAFTGSGANATPLGLLNDSDIAGLSIGTNGGELSWKNVVGLETLISTANADVAKMSYITNPIVRGAAKTTLKSAGVSGYLIEGNELNGYGVHSSNLIPSNLIKGTSENCSALLFGNWDDLNIFQWGGLDFLYDEITGKYQGANEITLNCYHNIFLKRKESFSVIKDITAEI